MAIDDDPFAPLDAERTFIMPTPGHQGRPPPPPAPPGPPFAPYSAGPAPEAPPDLEALLPEGGLNPLVAAASLLLQAVVALRASATHPDPAGLRDTLAADIRAFEARAAAAGATPQQLLAARYVLCTFIDEMVASTPWGGSGVWSRLSLLVMFHNEVEGGEKVFQLLGKLAQDPARHRELLELVYVVLALGFEGRYRVIDNGRSQLDQLRERLYAMVQEQRGSFERELSPRWQGVQVRRAALLQLPSWIVLAVAAGAALALYLGLSGSINRRSDPVFAQIQALRTAQAAPAPLPLPVAAPAARARLAALLEPEVRAGLVAVADYGDRSVVTVRGDGLFEPGGTAVSAAMQPLFARIGQALATLPGNVVVTGHTDNQPIRSARFPSNWHLSQERALAVRELLGAAVERSRIKAEGEADTRPVADNATAAGRARNRRVEITAFVTRAPT